MYYGFGCGPISTGIKKVEGADEVSQQVRVLVARPGNLNLRSRTHMVEGENQLLKIIL